MYPLHPPQGLCKLGSAGGTDYALRQFAEGSTEKLAKQCRKWVILFFFLLLFHTLGEGAYYILQRSCPRVALIYCCSLTADSAPRAHCTGTWSSSVPQATMCSSCLYPHKPFPLTHFPCETPDMVPPFLSEWHSLITVM